MDINNSLENIKVKAALKSESRNLEHEQIHYPDNVSVLRYTVIAALEKQIPKKVIKTELSSQACPECRANVNWKYCPNCGQKLDWYKESEVEEG